MSDRTVIHFAYGSNMSVRRLQDRVSSARLLGMGWLPDHRLAFHKRSKDGSGKCDVVPSDTCTVYGVLFQIDSTQETTLDHCEGLNSGYRKKEVRVRVSEERCMLAYLYYADNASVDPALKPYSWYLKHVSTGAEEASLPETYIERIRTTESIEDQDEDRKRRELSLYEKLASPWRQPRQPLEDPRVVDCDTAEAQSG